MYKKSKYNIFTEFEDDYLVTNTLNKTVVVLLNIKKQRIILIC